VEERSSAIRARRDGIRIKLAKASVSSAQEGEQHLRRLQDLAALPAKRECFFFSLSPSLSLSVCLSLSVFVSVSLSLSSHTFRV